MSSIIGTLGVPQLQIDGKVIDTTNLLRFYALTSSGAPSSGLYQSFGSTLYQVPSGKTLHIVAVKVSVAVSAATGIESFNIGYSDTSMGFNAGSGPTNPVYLNGTAQIGGAGGSAGIIMFTEGNVTSIEREIDGSVPATKYPFMSASSGSYSMSGIIYAYEI